MKPEFAFTNFSSFGRKIVVCIFSLFAVGSFIAITVPLITDRHSFFEVIHTHRRNHLYFTEYLMPLAAWYTIFATRRKIQFYHSYLKIIAGRKVTIITYTSIKEMEVIMENKTLCITTKRGQKENVHLGEYKKFTKEIITLLEKKVPNILMCEHCFKIIHDKNYVEFLEKLFNTQEETESSNNIKEKR